MKSGKGILFSLLLSAAAAFGQGTILWDESINGPLSPDFGNPTSLGLLQLGTNTVIGASEVVPTGPNWAGHPDLFTFQVQTNSLVGVMLLQIDKPNVWVGLKDALYLNDLAFASNSATGELLGQWGLASIGAGTYGMYVDNHDQQQVISVASYRLDFIVQSIPEPASLWLLLVGFGWLGFRGWRKPPLKP